MKLSKINEGKRRLRIFVSIIGAIIVYIIKLFGQGRIGSENLFIEFPVYSAIAFITIFLAITGLYWVLDGFSKHDQDIISPAPKIDSERLFTISEPFGMAFQKLLVDFSGMYQNQDSEIIKVRDQISDSWNKTALLYSYGITSVCMYGKDVNYLKSNISNSFENMVAEKYAQLSNEENKKYFPKYVDHTKSMGHAKEEVKKISDLVKIICSESSNSESLEDLLKPLNEYVSKITGLDDKETMKALGETGELFVVNINKKLA